MKKLITLLFLGIAQAFAQTNAIVYIDSYPGVSTDATSAIRQAIASLNGYGGTISFGQGSYPVYGTIDVPSYIRIVGQGWNSNIIGMNDVPILRTVDGAKWVNIENIRVYATSSSGSSYQIEGVNSTGLKINNVWIDAPVGRISAGIRIWNGVDTNALAGGVNTHIYNSLINQGSIWTKQSDGKITDNWIWSSEDSTTSPAPKLPFSIRIDNNNVFVSGNDIVSAPRLGGIILNGSQMTRIQGNFFDGSAEKNKTNTPILGYGLMFSSITGNTFWNNYGGPIAIHDGHHLTIADNVFYGNNRSNVSGNNDISIVNDGFPGNGIIVSGNNFFKDTLKVNGVAKIRVNTSAVNVSGKYPARVQVNNNAAHNMYGGYLAPFFSVPRDSSSVNNNRSQQYLNTRQGSVKTTVSGAQTLTVNFVPPLDYAPKPSEISLQYVGPTSTITGSMAINSISQSGFKIYMPSTGGINGTVYWKVEFQ